MKKFRLWISLVCATAAVAGCAATTGDFCDVSRPIYFDTGESFSTIIEADPALVRELIAHNEFHLRVCG